MNSQSSSKYLTQRPRSTACGEELQLPYFSKPKNSLRAFFCFCFPENNVIEEEKKSDSSNKISLLPHEFKYPLSSNINTFTNVSEEKNELSSKNSKKRALPSFRKKIFRSISDLWRKYPQNTPFFLYDTRYNEILLVRVSEIETEECKPRLLSSKVTKSLNQNEPTDEHLQDKIRNIRNSTLSQALYHIFKKQKGGFWMIVTGKDPETPNLQLQNFCKSGDFLLIMRKLNMAPSLRKKPFSPHPGVEYLQTNLYSTPKNLRGKFDVVIIDFFSHGTLNHFDECFVAEELIFALEMQLQQALLYSENLVLLIPCILDLSLLLPLFSDKKEIFSLEIEVLSSFNSNPELFIIYIGKFNRINEDIALDFMGDYLSKDSSIPYNILNIKQFLGHLIGKVGLSQIFKHILSAEEKGCSTNETLFQHFLDLLKYFGVITAEEQHEFLTNMLNSSFKENLSPFSFQKIPISKCSFSKEKSPDFNPSLKINLPKSPYTVESFSDYTPDNIFLESTDSNKIDVIYGLLQAEALLKAEKKEIKGLKKGIVREKSV